VPQCRGSLASALGISSALSISIILYHDLIHSNIEAHWSIEYCYCPTVCARMHHMPCMLYAPPLLTPSRAGCSKITWYPNSIKQEQLQVPCSVDRCKCEVSHTLHSSTKVAIKYPYFLWTPALCPSSPLKPINMHHWLPPSWKTKSISFSAMLVDLLKVQKEELIMLQGILSLLHLS